MRVFLGTILVCSAFLGLVGYLLVVNAPPDAWVSPRKVFMDECQQDMKRYECTALWLNGWRR